MYLYLCSSNEGVVHGFSYATIYPNSESRRKTGYSRSFPWNAPCAMPYCKMRHFLMTAKEMSGDEAISLMSAGVNFGITQVMDGNLGVHVLLKKIVFLN